MDVFENVLAKKQYFKANSGAELYAKKSGWIRDWRTAERVYEELSERIQDVEILSARTKIT